MLKKLQQLILDLFQPKDNLSGNTTVWVYLFGSILLLACGWSVYDGLQSVMDIQFADESAYIRFGLDLFGKLNRDWGPMYCIWYKCLSVISTDPIQLYYLNYVITSILIGVLLYIFLLRISIQSSLALLVSFSVLVSELNISVWPRISHFCIVLCLLFLIIITFIRNNIYKFLVFALLCLVSSYARPEFYLSFVAAMFVSLICIFINRQTLTKKDAVLFTGIAVIMILLHITFRFPSNNFFGFNRGVAAFYQHYAYNYKTRNNSPIDAWLYWEDICKRQFGDCNSMWCVIKTQPMIVLSNSLFNLKNYAVSTIIHGFSYIFPVGLFHSKKIRVAWMVLISIVAFVLLFRKESRQRFIQQLYSYKFYLLVLFIFIAPTILACVMVYPREHYVYLQMLFLLLIVVSLFNSLFDGMDNRSIVFFIFGCLLLIATPNIKNYSFLKVNNDTNLLCNKELVRYLSKNYSDKPHTLFTNMPFVRGMLPLNFREVNTIFDKKKHIPFTYYLQKENIDIVILTPATFRDPHIAFDTTWEGFIKNYESYHFKKEEFNDCKTYLLVKQP